MASLGEFALLVYVAAFTMLALAAIGLAFLFQVIRYRRREAEYLTKRRSKLGVATAIVEPLAPTSPVETAATGDAMPADSRKPIANDFLAIAMLCGREDFEAEKILARLADLLPSVMQSTSPFACRIEMLSSTWWSSGYLTPRREFKALLKVNGTDAGSIIIGPTIPSDEGLNEAESLLSAAAAVINLMLQRRADRGQLAKLLAEARQRESLLSQTQRIAQAGSWEYRRKEATFLWSDAIRQMTAMDADGKGGRDARKALAAQLTGAVEGAFRTRKPLALEFTFTPEDGVTRWLIASGDVEIGEEPEADRILGVIRDVSEEKATLNRAAHTANHDFLTGLPNRRFLQERLEAALVARNARGALLILDIDGFKDLNDTNGHDVGDLLLRDFSRCLYEAATDGFVARLGGDEFAVLFQGVDATKAEYAARALLASVSGPVVVFGHAISIHVSAGLAIYPADGRHSSELMKSADLALYEAKRGGRDLLVSYAPKFRDVIDQRRAICTEVRDALPQKQFLPFYQPKISLIDGQVAGFEALLRWNHPGGMRSPGAILPALADPALSRALCAAMLDGILLDVARWQAKGLPFGRVAFNASSSEFGEFDLAEHLLRRLKSMGIITDRIGVEVTETVFLNGAAESIRSTLEKLQRGGVEIALDDFGTGFASLTHLQEFPVDTIKIDQSFIRGLATDAGSKGITSAVLGLGQSLGKTVVAEGVETAEQARMLRAAGCDQVQGFLFARPMPASDVPGFLENWRGLDGITELVKKKAA